jgi:hypothetical protein
LILFISTAWAGGTMQLTGEVYGFTADTIQVSDGQNVYTIAKNKIFNKAPLAKNLKRGELIDVSVDFEGILETQAVKKKN